MKFHKILAIALFSIVWIDGVLVVGMDYGSEVPGGESQVNIPVSSVITLDAGKHDFKGMFLGGSDSSLVNKQPQNGYWVWGLQSASITNLKAGQKILFTYGTDSGGSILTVTPPGQSSYQCTIREPQIGGKQVTLTGPPYKMFIQFSDADYQEITFDKNNTITMELPAVQSTGTLSGTVTDSAGNAISGAAVQLGIGSNAQSKTTDATGKYSFSNVSVGSYTIGASKEGYEIFAQSGISVTAGGTTTQDISLQSITYHAVSVPAPEEFTQFWFSPVYTDGTYGEYQVSNSNMTQLKNALNTGSVDISFTMTPSGTNMSGQIIAKQGTTVVFTQPISLLKSNSGDVPSSQTINHVNLTIGQGTGTLVKGSVGNTATSCNLRLTAAAPQAGSITGTVTDSAGNAISGATVKVTAGPTTGGFATTDASGNYTLSNLQFGTYTLEASATNYGTTSQSGLAISSESKNVTFTFELTSTTTSTSTNNQQTTTGTVTSAQLVNMIKNLTQDQINELRVALGITSATTTTIPATTNKTVTTPNQTSPTPQTTSTTPAPSTQTPAQVIEGKTGYTAILNALEQFKGQANQKAAVGKAVGSTQLTRGQKKAIMGALGF